ncbi:MAG: AraC family transcriptional regulator [Desulfobacterales bacterium]|nr:AraC family transcriptional regulator [Desulfobacterales bacterium]
MSLDAKTRPVAVSTDYIEPVKGDSNILDRCSYDVRGTMATHDLVRFFKVKTGLAMSATGSGYGKLSEVEYETLNAPVSFYFILSGRFSIRVRGKAREIDLNAGSSIISSMPGTTGRITIPPQKALTVVELKMDRTFLHTYLENCISNVPPEILHLLDPGKRVIAAQPLSREITDLLVQIVHPPVYTAGVMTLFYESRALDLLALQLESFLRAEKAAPGFDLSASDVERIHAAHDLLLSEFRDPPTISTLARICGINEFKLKKGFKQTFGMTIFGFIKQQKMKTAWDLIKDDGISVTRAASEVGYTNVSHFINAFRRRFSINPGQLKRSWKIREIPVKNQ